MPEASAWLHGHAQRVADTHLQAVEPADLAQARETRATASTGGYGVMGTPPTPMPTFMCMGIVASCTQGLTMVRARATFQATVRVVLTFTAGPKIVTPASAASSI